jgi:hypothetical protein
MQTAHRIAILGLSGLLLALAGGPGAIARDTTAERRCTGQLRAKPDARIAACAALIKSGRFQGQALGKLHRGRAEALSAKGRAAEAIADLDAALRLDVLDRRSYLLRGQAYLEKREFARADADFTAAIELEPKDAEGYFKRGLVREQQGDKERATADYGRAIGLDPKLAAAYAKRGERFAKTDAGPAVGAATPVAQRGVIRRGTARSDHDRDRSDCVGICDPGADVAHAGRRRTRACRLGADAPPRPRQCRGIQQPRTDLVRAQGLRQGHRRFRRGNPRRAGRCPRLQQPR